MSQTLQNSEKLGEQIFLIYNIHLAKMTIFIVCIYITVVLSVTTGCASCISIEVSINHVVYCALWLWMQSGTKLDWSF